MNHCQGKKVGTFWCRRLLALACLGAILLIAAPVKAELPPLFLFKWGISGVGNGQFNFPMGIAPDRAGNLYVADYDNDRIQKFDANGAFLTKWGSTGTADSQFQSPMGVAVDSLGDVYVVDTNNHRVQKFDANGVFLTKWGSIGTGDGQFSFPRCITTDGSDNIYVVDDNHVQKFDQGGNLLAKWGSRGSGVGQFSKPAGIAADSSNNIYVADTYNWRVQKFSSTGTFLSQWGSWGSGDGQFIYPKGVAIDIVDNVYVVDTNNNRVQKFDKNGNFLLKWGSSGTGDGQFSGATGFAINTAGRMFVTDTYNNRIQAFALNLKADAGSDQTVAEGDLVQLNGANSIPPEYLASYLWEKISGPGVILSDPTSSQPTFFAPDVGPDGASLTFRLTVTDRYHNTSQDTCIVNVTWVNAPPVARAGGNQTVPEKTLVTLDGSQSYDPDDGVNSYFWQQTAGPAVELSSAAAAKPSFTAPSVGAEGAAFAFQLTVTDNHGLSAADTCIVNVTWVNEAPVADAGDDQTVDERTLVTLNGSRSYDPDQEALASYYWTQQSGFPVTLSDPTATQPTFTAPQVGPTGAALTFKLTVTDQGGLQSSDECTVQVLWVNTPPQTEAGNNQTILSKDQNLLTLQGTASDADGDPLSYRWLEGGTGLSPWQPAVAGLAPLNLAALPPLGVGSHTLTLEVSDGFAVSRDEMILTIDNSAPTAAPTGGGTFQVNTTVILTGQVSDYDGDLVTCQWLEGGVVLSEAAVQTSKGGSRRLCPPSACPVPRWVPMP